MPEKHYCPICSEKTVFPEERFPNRVCESCQSKTADAYGRRLRFTNTGSPGGLRAVYRENGEEYKRRLCYIDGRKCFATEHRFGGVVVEVVKK